MRRKLTGVLWDAQCIFWLKVRKKQATKNVQLVLPLCFKQVQERCCVFYHLRKKTLQPDLLHARQVRRWVIKRATSPFNSFCSSVSKLITGFLLPVLNNTKPLQWTGVPESLGMNMKLTVWLLLHNCNLKVNCYCKLHLLAFYYFCCRYISFKHWVIFAGDKLQ